MSKNNFKQALLDFDKRIKIDGLYSKKEIEKIFCTNFGARIKGITLRRDSVKNRYIILFHAFDSIYSDNGSKDNFIYCGEGANGDQKLTAANKALIEAVEDERPIYGFWQNEKGADYEYIGRLKVKKWEYTKQEGRMIYQYEILSI